MRAVKHTLQTGGGGNSVCQSQQPCRRRGGEEVDWSSRRRVNGPTGRSVDGSMGRLVVGKSEARSSAGAQVTLVDSLIPEYGGNLCRISGGRGPRDERVEHGARRMHRLTGECGII